MGATKPVHSAEVEMGPDPREPRFEYDKLTEKLSRYTAKSVVVFLALLERRHQKLLSLVCCLGLY